jgi:hypothetical protein
MAAKIARAPWQAILVEPAFRGANSAAASRHWLALNRVDRRSRTSGGRSPYSAAMIP